MELSFCWLFPGLKIILLLQVGVVLISFVMIVRIIRYRVRSRRRHYSWGISSPVTSLIPGKLFEMLFWLMYSGCEDVAWPVYIIAGFFWWMYNTIINHGKGDSDWIGGCLSLFLQIMQVNLLLMNEHPTDNLTMQYRNLYE